MCSNQKISCVRIKRFPVFESKDFVCSNQKISCARIRRFRVFQSRHLVCSNQDMSCVPTTRCPVFQSRHFLVPKQHHSSQIRHATFDRILAIVPGFFRFVTQKGRILGRSPKFAQKWRVKFWVRKKFSEFFFSKIFFRRQKIKNSKSSETRVAEVSRRSEPCSQGSWPPRRDSRSVNNLMILGPHCSA